MAEQSWTGIYRAKVIDSHDPKKKGRVKIWCPQTMPDIEPDKITQDTGIWAFLANNPVGGRNLVENTKEQYNQGSCFLPQKGSWVYIFFEDGDPSQPRVLSACDVGNTQVPPENQQGPEYEKKWTVLRSQQGRTFFVSDDPYDERIEFTGKKRKISNTDSASGNPESVYEIEGNQNVILIDERNKKEKILIKDHKGNFINFDIENQKLHVFFQDDIHVKTKTNLYVESVQDMHINAKNFFLTASENINIKSGQDSKFTAQGNFDLKVNGISKLSSKSNFNIKTPANLNMDGSMSFWQNGNSVPATSSPKAISASPIGNRNPPEISSQLKDEVPLKSDKVPKLKKFDVANNE